MKILVLNSGSSSQKSSLYDIGETLPDDPPVPLWEGKVEWHDEVAEAEVKGGRGVVQKDQVKVSSRAEAVEHLLGTLWDGKTRAVTSRAEIDVAGHRVVHGGPKYEEPVLLTSEVKSGIAKVSAFAPLHNRAELEGIEVIEKMLGPIPQVAVFDTEFHRKMPGRGCVSRALSMVRKRYSPLRIPRHQPSILRCACRAGSTPRLELAQIGYLPSRQRLFPGCDSRRPQHRHHDGIYSVRRSHDGYSLWFG